MKQLARGDDGLFRMKDGSQAVADPTVQIGAGTLESSNVNTADAMVTMIELARHFEMQVKAIPTGRREWRRCGVDHASRLIRSN